MRETWTILGAGAALIAALVGVVSFEGQARVQGREVALVMEGVDPRGLLTGHYARLALRDPTPSDGACPPGTQSRASAERRGWVALAPAERGWRVQGQAPTRAEALAMGPVAVRGFARCFGDGVELDVGVRRFHADQSEAEALEEALQPGRTGAGEAFALISVGRDGRARLKGIEVNGRRVELDWF